MASAANVIISAKKNHKTGQEEVWITSPNHVLLFLISKYDPEEGETKHLEEWYISPEIGMAPLVFEPHEFKSFGTSDIAASTAIQKLGNFLLLITL